MSTSRIRGWAGVALAALGLLLLRAGPGIAVSASAAPGCRETDACRAVNSVEGSVGGQGIVISSSTATCEGNCNGNGNCQEISWQNADGSRTFQCSCSDSSLDGCSGYATVRSVPGSDGTPVEECTEFTCEGPCDPGNPPTDPPPKCERKPFNTHVSQDCPAVATGKLRCECK